MSSVIVAPPVADIWNVELLASHYNMTEMLVNAVHIVGRVGVERFVSLERQVARDRPLGRQFTLINC